MISNKKNTSHSGWSLAAQLCERYDKSPEKADKLLGELCKNSALEVRRRCQSLFYGILRNRERIDWEMSHHVAKSPRSKLRALLRVGVFELLDAAPEKRPQVVDGSVTEARAVVSAREAGFVNAVLRRVSEGLAEAKEESLPLSIRYSHPEWLMNRWMGAFGAKHVQALLEWNHSVPPVFIRLRGVTRQQAQTGHVPEGLKATQWDDFYEVLPGAWQLVEQLLAEGCASVQDPSTSVPVGLLNARPGEPIADLCAAPGGKTLAIADALAGRGRIVAVDMPERANILHDSLAKAGDTVCSCVSGDLLELELEPLRASSGMPGGFAGVLLDAPCSNTGVIRRRPDVKYRLDESDIHKCAEKQYQLLRRAAGLVRPGGRIVYSTCSIESEENNAVVERFLTSDAGKRFRLSQSRQYYPWQHAHDGGACFKLECR